MIFRNRSHAGIVLAEYLHEYAKRSDVTVVALPRGGVPVAFEVAEALEAPLDVFLVRKLGLPGHEEFAIGAVASGGTRVLNERIVRELRIPEAVIDSITQRERVELDRRERAYRRSGQPIDVRGRIVIVVDDGLATGSTMRAAVAALRLLCPAKVVIAVPTAAPSARTEMGGVADDFVCVSTPPDFRAVGQWYEDFGEVTDEEVRALLDRAPARVTS